MPATATSVAYSELGTCHDGSGTPGAAVDCDDEASCSTDSCDKAKGCQHVALGDGASCDDGDACKAALAGSQA